MARRILTGAPRIGRRVGITSFWLMAVVVIGTSTRSVVMELYGNGDEREASSAELVSCAHELRMLERSLLDHAAQDVRWPGHASDTQKWIASWDKQYASLGPCGSLDTARKTLFRLRERTVALLHAHLRQNLPLTESIDRMINQIDTRFGSVAR